MLRVFAAEPGFEGSEADYAHLAKFGITEEADNRFLDIDQYLSTGDRDFNADEDVLLEINEFLSQPDAIEAFLKELLTKYRAADPVAS